MSNQIEQLEATIKDTLASGIVFFDEEACVLKVTGWFTGYAKSTMLLLVLGAFGLLSGGVVFLAGPAVPAEIVGVLGLALLALFGWAMRRRGLELRFAEQRIVCRKTSVPFREVRAENMAWQRSGDGHFLKLMLHTPAFSHRLAEFRTEEEAQARRFHEQIWRLISAPDLAGIAGHGSDITPVQRWILGTSAIFADVNGCALDRLGVRPNPMAARLDRQHAAKILREAWSTTTPEELLINIAALRHSRGRFMIWDYCRAMMLFRWGHMLGWLPETYCWDRMLPLARDIQRNYTSWSDMAACYLQGRRLWAGGEAEYQDRFEESAKRLGTDFTSPWNIVDWNLPLVEDWRPVPFR